MVKRGKQEDDHFDDALVGAAVELIRVCFVVVLVVTPFDLSSWHFYYLSN